MDIKAFKMDGLGNDFVIIDQRSQNYNLTKDQIIKMLSHIFPEVKIFNDDSGDALAIAICHLMNVKFLDEKDLY